ncbi:MAG: prolipoprotein diacylglyceryl transferase family protein, partial [Dehalococcoidia bacterium]
VDFISAIVFLAIDIDIDPTIGSFGPFEITYHGLFTAVGILAGVTLSVYLARRDGIPPDLGQEIAIVGVVCAIIGARLLYVGEHWRSQFSDDIPSIITGINEGGITLYGGLIGGALGGALWGIYRKAPIAIGLDCAAPGMILGQAIGRLGDLINGEHLATESSLPWAVRYVHPNTLGELGRSVHPTAGGYELLGDLVICALLVFVARRYLKVPGWVFCSYIILYSGMRFFLSYLRVDEQDAWGVPIPQIVAGFLVGFAIVLAGVLVRHPGPITREYAKRAWDEVPPGDPEASQPASA